MALISLAIQRNITLQQIKLNFALIFNEAFKLSMTLANISSAFETCRIYPFNAILKD